MWLMTAATVSNLGDGLRMAALPLVAVHLTNSKFMVTAVSSVNRLPWIAAPLIGALVDRWDRRRVMVTADLTRAVCGALVTAALFARAFDIELLGAAAIVLGIGEVFFDTASIAVTPAVVSQEQLDRANARVVGGETAANQFVGQPLGGVATSVSAGLPFAVDSLSFLLSAVFLGRLRGNFRAAGPVAESSVIRDLAVGVRWFARQRTMLVLTIAVGVLGLAGGAVQATLVLLVVDTFHGSDTEFGLVLGAGAVGALAGALVSARLARALGFRRTLLCSLLAGCVTYAGIGLAPDVVVAAISFVGVGATVTLWNVATITIRQRMVPDEMLGRVQAIYRMVAYGTYPAGALGGGVLAASVSVRAPDLAAAAALALLVPLVALSRPGQELSDGTEEEVDPRAA